MSFAMRLAFGLLILATLAGGVVWMIARQVKRSSEDKGVLVIKWLLTLLLLVTSVIAVPVFSFVGIGLIVACGVVFSILWAPTIGEWVARPITSAIDGGSTPPAPAPLYSMAEAQRKRGHYSTAVAELRKQLEKFPHDFATQMMLAEIQAENLGDLEAARLTIDRLAHQTEHTPRNRAFALTQMADWELSRGRDPEAARQLFERIQQWFPETELATLAAQRLAHLPVEDPDALPPVRAPMALPHGDTPSPEDLFSAAEARAVELTRHLALHPLDAEAREALAQLYAEELANPDRALVQLEGMVSRPNQPARNVAHWLNQIADVHVRHRHDRAAAEAALKRVIERFPDTQFAETAVARLDRLGFEFRGNEASRAVKLGSYADDLGLKRPG